MIQTERADESGEEGSDSDSGRGLPTGRERGEMWRCLRLIETHRGDVQTMTIGASGPGFMMLDLRCDSPFGWKSMELSTDYDTGHALMVRFDRIRPWKRRRARR